MLCCMWKLKALLWHWRTQNGDISSSVMVHVHFRCHGCLTQLHRALRKETALLQKCVLKHCPCVLEWSTALCTHRVLDGVVVGRRERRRPGPRRRVLVALGLDDHVDDPDVAAARCELQRRLTRLRSVNQSTNQPVNQSINQQIEVSWPKSNQKINLLIPSLHLCSGSSPCLYHTHTPI